MRRVEVEEMWFAMNQMKIGKASGPSWVVAEMFKAGGDKYLESLTTYLVISCSRISYRRNGS